MSRSSHQICSIEIGVLKNFAKFTGKHLCQSLFFNKKETLAQVFSCKLCGISQNTFFTDHFWASASVFCLNAGKKGLEKLRIRKFSRSGRNTVRVSFLNKIF